MVGFKFFTPFGVELLTEEPWRVGEIRRLVRKKEMQDVFMKVMHQDLYILLKLKEDAVPF